MSRFEEDLATDSVPDPPRDFADSNSCECSGEEEDKDAAKKGEEKPKPLKQEKKKKKRPAPPKPGFNIPDLNSSGSSTIYISNASNVHVGNRIEVNFVGQAFSQHGPSKSPSPEPRNIEKSKEVKDACKSTERITLEHLDAVSEHVGKCWMKLGEHLGYSQEQMERFHEDHHQLGLKEVVYQMLLDWKQFQGAKAQVATLCHHLWSTRHYTAAEKLAALCSVERS